MSEDESHSESGHDGRALSPWRRRLVAFTVLLLLIGGGGYLLHLRGVDLIGVLTAMKSSSGDVATSTRVKTALALSRRVSAFDIDVDTTGGVVRLTGEVPSEGVRELAVAIASDTAGVEQVEDHLRVNPGARPSPELERLKKRVADLEIQTVLNAALVRNTDLVGKDILVTVEDRRVTLEGFVEDSDDKFGAERIAAGLEGVMEVVNQIEVTAADQPETPARAEHSLAKRLRFELFASDAFDMERIEVSAAEGVATLKGEVRSQAERLLAERIVRDVEGVDTVVNELAVPSVPDREETGADSSQDGDAS